MFKTYPVLFSALCLCLVLCSQVAEAQPSSPIRDASAMKIVETSIKTMGGRATWSGVLHARTEWTAIDVDNPSQPCSETWEDDWEQGFLIFNHQRSDAEGVRSIHADANHHVVNQRPDGSKILPRRLQDIALPLHLPAESLLLILEDSQRGLQFLGFADSERSIALIRIVRVDRYGFRDPFAREDWEIDLNTGYPVQVNFFTEDILHKSAYPQTIQYSSYKHYGDKVIPTVLRYNLNDGGSILQLSSTSLK